jgi:hypothetical protein
MYNVPSVGRGEMVVVVTAMVDVVVAACWPSPVHPATTSAAPAAIAARLVHQPITSR